ncbi:hypothetical protein I2486_15895 [Cellulophaga sp. E16_2]|uniref:hypothetical protein n=1 Tax=Cellulophaga sp. E16_2 TaxID=2789297 RepID=UPI001A92252B|nr:hypothetical protein [Cellulophaga sp. E16_2]MBO0592887.1 hypothetical protein [Cellulophaga sp. E16_2]
MKPFFFGLEKKIISKEEFYFDHENFYAMHQDLQKKAFKLSAITELKKTSIQITNRRIWQITIKETNNADVVFKFAHNYTLWNKNFALFHEKIKKINPEAIKSKWSLWSM